jgi:hypothetical protein
MQPGGQFFAIDEFTHLQAFLEDKQRLTTATSLLHAQRRNNKVNRVRIRKAPRAWASWPHPSPAPAE